MLSYKNRREEKSPTGNFFIRRFFRIAPVYYLALLLYQLAWSTEFKSGIVLSNIFFVHGFSPYWINSGIPGGWSVGVEMTFYLLFPFVVVFITNLNRALLFALFAFVLRIAFFVYFSSHPLADDASLWEQFLEYNFINQLPVFALGFILYFLIYERSAVHPYAFLLLAALTVFLYAWDLKVNYFLMEIALFVLAFALSQKEFPLLVNPVLTYIGKISFSMYICHIAVIFLLEETSIDHAFSSAALNFFLYESVVIVEAGIIASLSYYFIEKPFIKLGHRLVHKREAKAKLL